MSVPRLAIIGWSGAGKTTLIERLVPRLRAFGLRVGVVKHSSHEHPLHKPGSDTERFAKAGAAWVGFETPRGIQMSSDDDSVRLYPRCDLVLIEGNKDASGPKIEVASTGELLASQDREVWAIVGRTSGVIPPGVATVAADDLEGLALLVLAWWQGQRQRHGRPEGSTTRASRVIPRRPGDIHEPAPAIALEEPLEIRVQGDPLATTMRTPGQDDRLAVGFLWAEGILRERRDLGTIVHCRGPRQEDPANVIDVSPAPGVLLDIDRVRSAKRGTLTTSACGVCGRQNIEDLLARVQPLSLSSGPQLASDCLRRASQALSEHQTLFDATGGTHAAGILDAQGKALCVFEDVGRHNAVDKAVGELVLSERLGPLAALLVVSGRASFEIVQKAAMARIPCVVSVSAASALAIDLAQRAGITLASFARGRDFVLYTHEGRVSGL